MCLRAIFSLMCCALRGLGQQSQQPYNSHQGNMYPQPNPPPQTFHHSTGPLYPYKPQEVFSPGAQQPPQFSYGLGPASGVSDHSFTWDKLILTPANQTSPLFTRLIDAIFTYFKDSPASQGLNPVQYASAFTALMYSDNENKVRYFYIFATQNRFPSPEAFVNDAMDMLYRSYNISYTTQNGQPVLTREGFHAIMLRDTLGDPDCQCRRFNAFLGAHGLRVLDPATGRPFPNLIIPRSSFPPSRDNAVLQRAQQCQEAFNRELSTYLKDMTRISQNLHADTMGAIWSLPGGGPVAWTEVTYTNRPI